MNQFELLNDNCLPILDKFISENRKVDCIITSPPYNMNLRVMKGKIINHTIEHLIVLILPEELKQIFGKLSVREINSFKAGFPTALIEKILVNFTNENDIILDPFMGSGTCGIVCKEMNRNFIGIELNKNMFKIAKERIENINK